MSSIDAYLQRVEKLTPTQHQAHLRTDYTPNGPDWIEFLDFIDECKIFFKEKLELTRRDFIYRYYAIHSQKFQCTGHTHTFHADPRHPGDTLVSSPDMYIDPSTCWWIKMSQLDDQLLSDDKAVQCAYLSQPEHAYLARLAALRLAISEGYPSPIGFTFSEFQDLWSRGPSRKHALDVLSRSEPITTLPLKIIEEVRAEQTPPPPQWLAPSKGPRVIRTNTDVFQDHGFHRLMVVRHDARHILKIINNIRSNSSPPIAGEEIAMAMLDCDLCKDRDFGLNTSPPGVYYSPPGSGKSTASKHGWFIGIDTDWLLHSSNYNTIIKPFVDIHIPVVTNQYHLACHSGERFFGYFNPNALRLDPSGRPYTSLHEIVTAQKQLKSDLFLIFGDKYFQDALPELFRAAYFYNESRIRFMDKKRPPIHGSRPFKTLHGHKDYDAFISQLQSWSKSRKHKRRLKLLALAEDQPQP